MSGVDLATLKDLLGHASIKMTLRYSHLAPGHRRAAVEGISDRLSLPASTAQITSQSATEKKKGLEISLQAFGFSGGADRDRTDGLLNAIRKSSPSGLEIPHDFDYPDGESGD